MMFLYTLDVIGILFYFLFYLILFLHFIFALFYLLYYTLMLWVIICYTLIFWVFNSKSCDVINLVLLVDGIDNYCSSIYVTDVTNPNFT